MSGKIRLTFLFMFTAQLLMLLILINHNIYISASLVFICIICLTIIYVNLNNKLKGILNIDATVEKYYKTEEKLDDLKNKLLSEEKNINKLEKKKKEKKRELATLKKEIDTSKELLEENINIILKYKEQTLEFENKLNLQQTVINDIKLKNKELDNTNIELENRKKELDFIRKEIKITNDKSGKYNALIARAKKTIIQEELSTVDKMDGIEFEKYLAMIFTSNGYESTVTKASGDQGADLILEKNNVKYAVQAKRYSNPVSNKAVQEVISSRLFYNLDSAIVVTSNYFTQSARDLAECSDVRLIDRMGLYDLIDQAIDNNPSLYADKSKTSTIIEINR